MGLTENDIKGRIIQDIRPWGNYKRYARNEECTVKILAVQPNQRLSKQLHKNRDEVWVILDEGLQVELEDKIINPKPGDEIVILRNAKHRLSSLGKKARVLEIAFGYADEDDIVRSEDDYGRK